MLNIHGEVCTCPVCCPDKWTMNRMRAERYGGSHGQAFSQQVVRQMPSHYEQLEEVLMRLERIEAILVAHVNGNDR